MSASIAQAIVQMAEEGLQITLWPSEKGYQANVKEQAGRGWTCVSDVDPVKAVERALRQRLSGHALRDVVRQGPAEPEHVDIEVLIAEQKSTALDCAHGIPDNLPCGACEDEYAVDGDGFCMVCEGGGCDLCSPPSDDDMIAGMIG